MHVKHERGAPRWESIRTDGSSLLTGKVRTTQTGAPAPSVTTHSAPATGSASASSWHSASRPVVARLRPARTSAASSVATSGCSSANAPAS